MADNQCDGCLRGDPVNANGNHYTIVKNVFQGDTGIRVYMVCQRSVYEEKTYTDKDGFVVTKGERKPAPPPKPPDPENWMYYI